MVRRSLRWLRRFFAHETCLFSLASWQGSCSANLKNMMTLSAGASCRFPFQGRPVLSASVPGRSTFLPAQHADTCRASPACCLRCARGPCFLYILPASRLPVAEAPVPSLPQKERGRERRLLVSAPTQEIQAPPRAGMSPGAATPCVVRGLLPLNLSSRGGEWEARAKEAHLPSACHVAGERGHAEGTAKPDPGKALRGRRQGRFPERWGICPERA